jgi:hypothetical protein
MDAIVRLWNRLLVAFAKPASGKGQGAPPPAADAAPPATEAHPGPDPHAWKSHGGDRG